MAIVTMPKGCNATQQINWMKARKELVAVENQRYDLYLKEKQQ